MLTMTVKHKLQIPSIVKKDSTMKTILLLDLEFELTLVLRNRISDPGWPW